MDSGTKNFQDQLEDALKGAALFDREHARLLVRALVDLKIDVDNALFQSERQADGVKKEINVIRQYRYSDEKTKHEMALDIEVLKKQVRELKQTIGELKCQNNPKLEEQSSSFVQKLLRTSKQK